MKPFFKVGLLLLVCSSFTNAQFASGKEIQSKAVLNTINKYHTEINYQSGLYNGNKYLSDKYFLQKNGHRFFISREALKGSVVYDGVLYSDIYLMHDEVSDELIFKDFSKKIQLINILVSEFTISDFGFVKIATDEPTLKEGFYQVLYNGKYRVLKKEVKSILEDISSASDGIKRYVNTDYFYLIERDSRYYPIKKKKDLLRIEGFSAKETQKLIKDKKLNFKKNRDVFLTDICEFYDQKIGGE